jgi:diguanylate cyclase (GGDEF)-like protein
MNLEPLGREEASRTSELRREIRRLESRDLHLWIIGLAVIVVLSLGFAALVFPNVVWHVNILPSEARYLPQLFFGFIILIALFEVYTLQRRRGFQSTRDEMVHELVRREAAEKLALVDPLTEVFNRRYLDQLLAKEVNRADRRETPIAFLMLDVSGFKSFNTRFGHRKGDHLLGDVAQMLRRTFRASDSIVRSGGDEFLVVMPDTDEASAQRAVVRLLSQVEAWNRAHPEEGSPLALDTGVAVYAKGADIAQVLETAGQKLDQRKSG